jgi:DnaJ-class molecular chaperone
LQGVGNNRILVDRASTLLQRKRPEDICMADPYQILGVTREATQEDIRKAYRRLAKMHHPDLHPGDKDAETRFKEIASAYDIIGDDKKRARFDSGEIDATGAERPQQPEREFYRQHAEAGPDFRYERRWGDGAGQEDADLFSELFGARRAETTGRGSDVHYTFSVEFTEAINGAKKRVVMADGKALDITIPAGLKDGQSLRLRGQGLSGTGGADSGDALVEIHVKPHPVFRRDGTSIRSTLPVTPGEALGGSKVRVATVSGPVDLTIPKNSNSGTVLRLRGRGVPSKGGKGDHLVKLQIVLPDNPDEELVGCITDWEAKHPYNPRKDMEARS